VIGVREVAGSNPVVPTISIKHTAASFGSRSCVVAIVLQGDTRNLEHYLAEDYVETTPSGQTMTKKRTLEVYQPGVYESGVLDAVKVRVYANTAIVNGIYLVKFKVREATEQYRYTNVWVRQHNKWQMISSQTTRVRDEHR
jgi:hypothetical protein